MSAEAITFGGGMGKQDPIKLALGTVIVIAVLYYLARKTVSDTVDAVGSGIGDIAAGIYTATKPGVSVLAKVRLPNGTLVDPSAGTFLSVGDNTAQWRYGGVTYTLGSRNDMGQYPATQGG